MIKENRFADFHTELEKVGEEDQQNQYIKFAITLEQSLAVGNYSNLFESRKKSPLPHFNVFLDRILETIRFKRFSDSELTFDLDMKSPVVQKRHMTICNLMARSKSFCLIQEMS